MVHKVEHTDSHSFWNPALPPPPFQMPDVEKRRRADYMINTSLPLDDTEAQVVELVCLLRAKAAALQSVVPVTPCQGTAGETLTP